MLGWREKLSWCRSLFPATKAAFQVGKGQRQTGHEEYPQALAGAAPGTEVCTGGPHGLTIAQHVAVAQAPLLGSPASLVDELGQTTASVG